MRSPGKRVGRLNAVSEVRILLLPLSLRRISRNNDTDNAFGCKWKGKPMAGNGTPLERERALTGLGSSILPPSAESQVAS